jgi:hypothetical protein
MTSHNPAHRRRRHKERHRDRSQRKSASPCDAAQVLRDSPLSRADISIAPLTRCASIAGLATRAFIDPFPVFRHGLSALTCLGSGHARRALLGLPRVARVRVIAASLLSVIARGDTAPVSRAFRECARGEHHAYQHYQNPHGRLRVCERHEAAALARVLLNGRRFMPLPDLKNPLIC